jgi:preprotein translocase subunit Sss1
LIEIPDEEHREQLFCLLQRNKLNARKDTTEEKTERDWTFSRDEIRWNGKMDNKLSGDHRQPVEIIAAICWSPSDEEFSMMNHFEDRWLVFLGIHLGFVVAVGGKNIGNKPRLGSTRCSIWSECVMKYNEFVAD